MLRFPVRSIVFLAAPHHGLDNKALSHLVKGQPTERLISELSAESPTLTTLNEDFYDAAVGIEILTCYEGKATKTAVLVLHFCYTLGSN